MTTTEDLRTLLREGFDSPEHWYSLRTTRAETGTVAELLIYDVIGWWPNDAETLARELKALEADEIIVRINSPGGSVFDGFAIYNALRAHAASVTTIVEGLAASAASLIALAGDKVVMRPASELMIHDAWTAVAGPAEEMRKTAEHLDRVNTIVAGIYAAKAGTPVVVVNRGPTRGDHLATVRLDAGTSETLTALAHALATGADDVAAVAVSP